MTRCKVVDLTSDMTRCKVVDLTSDMTRCKVVDLSSDMTRCKEVDLTSDMTRCKEVDFRTVGKFRTRHFTSLAFAPQWCVHQCNPHVRTQPGYHMRYLLFSTQFCTTTFSSLKTGTHNEKEYPT